MKARMRVSALLAASAALLVAGCEPGRPDAETSPAETPAAETPAPAPESPAPGEGGSETPAPDGMSAYTTIDLDACEVTGRYEEGSGTDWRCQGRNGIPVLVRESDGRFDVDAGVTGGAAGIGPFNNLSETIEWRGPASAPYAIIYRLRSATPEMPNVSWLVVEAIGTASAPGCPVAIIEGGVASANNRARELADTRARDFRCDVDEPRRLTP